MKQKPSMREMKRKLKGDASRKHQGQAVNGNTEDVKTEKDVCRKQCLKEVVSHEEEWSINER